MLYVGMIREMSGILENTFYLACNIGSFTTNEFDNSGIIIATFSVIFYVGLSELFLALTLTYKIQNF